MNLLDLLMEPDLYSTARVEINSDNCFWQPFSSGLNMAGTYRLIDGHLYKVAISNENALIMTMFIED